MRQQMTLVYLLREGRVCLGKKKRGFGEGWWNGYGGKVKEGEGIIDAAIRELEEESGVIARTENLENRGVLEFFFEDGLEIETHVFFIHAWEGEPVETEEMAPQWFSYDAIPYDQMWADDQYWMPHAFEGEMIHGKVWFGKDGSGISKMEWNFN